MAAAIQSAVEYGLRPFAWLLADRLRGFFWSRRNIVDWLTVTRTALAAAESEGDQKAQAAMRASKGNAYQALGRYTDAITCYIDAADRAGEAGWLEGKGSALANLGVALNSKGDHQTALNCFHQAFGLYERSEWRGGMALILGNLGHLYIRVGQLRRSSEFRSREMAALRELGFGTGVSMAYAAHNLGSVERDLGKLGSSIANLNIAAALFRKAGNRHGEVHVLDTLAGTHLIQGRVIEAHELAQSAVELAGEIGDPRAEGEARITLGDVHNQAGRHEDALACHLRAIELARRIQAPETEIRALNGLAAAAHHQSGGGEEAYTHAQEALLLARKYSYRILEGHALTVLAEVLLAQRRYEEAVEYARLALENHRTTGHRLGEARSLTILGTALHRIGDPQALAHHDIARKLFVDLGAPVPRGLAAQ